MNRLFYQAISSITLVGYFLAVTWGPAWHDHQHGHCHAPAETDFSTSKEAVSAHGRCCSHHHAACPAEIPKPAAGQSVPTPSPCQSPLHDDDCVICQYLAHPPLSAPAIQVVDAIEAMPDWVVLFLPAVVGAPPAVYHSRGPPVV